MCEFGFGFNNNGECEKCSDNCENCFFNSSICTKCEIGFSIETNEKGESYCVKCNDENCVECNQNSTFCSLCKDGFITQMIGEGKNKCVSINGDDPEGNNDQKKKPKTGMIVGIVVACIVVVAIIIFILVYIFVIRKNKHKILSNAENEKDVEWDIRPDDF